MARRGLSLLLWAAATAPTARAAGSAERPVMKVVRLLQDMQQELTASLEDDKAVHEKLSCWCTKNEQEKTKAVEEGEQRETQLKAFLEEAAARLAELQVKRDKTLAEVNADEAALQQASTLRMKENQAFHSSETELIEAIQACGQVIVVLSKHNAQPGSSQLQSAAKLLEKAQVLELGKRRWGSRARPYVAALNSLLSHLDGSSSFLAVPGYQSYAPQSGQIYGVLEQMKVDFEKDLSEAQEREKSAAEAYEELKAAKMDEIAAGRKLQAELDEEIADLKEKHAQAFKELEDVQAQLALDREFLANLRKKCSETEAEFNQRVQDRTAEIAAVEDAVKILNSDEAFDNFSKTFPASLLQTSSSTFSADQKARLRRAIVVLQRAAASTAGRDLSLLLTTAQFDAFTKVRAAIDKMVVELTQQQKDEVGHYDWCKDEIHENSRSTAEGEDDKTSIVSKLEDLDKTIERLAKEIEAVNAEVAEMQDQMKRASEVREGENADFQQTVTDHRLAQMVLRKAHDRLLQVYAFAQEEPQPGAAHTALSGTHTDPGNGPARFTKYEKHAGGGRVLRLIEEVIEDSKKTENDALKAERDSQSAYESFMIFSNKGLEARAKAIVDMTAGKAAAEEERVAAKADLESTMKKLEELHETLGGLKTSCDFLLKNFDARQSARAAEIDALKQAKAILAGAK